MIAATCGMCDTLRSPGHKRNERGTFMISKLPALLGIATFVVIVSNPSAYATPIQIYGVWHAGNDACIWGGVRNLVEFDRKNHWIIDRGDGIPSVNLVILSFVQPLKLLRKASDSQ